MFEPGNVEELTRKLQIWMQKDDNERHAMGLALRREVEARFSIEREVHDHEAFYLGL